MTETSNGAEFEHETLPTAEELFTGFRTVTTRHGDWRLGDSVHEEAESFVLDGETLPLDVQTLVDSIQFVPPFDDHGEAGGDYLTFTLPPNPKGLVRMIQICTIAGDYSMDSWDDDSEEGERVDEVVEADPELLRALMSQNLSPTDSEVRRLGRVLKSLREHYGDF